MKGNRKWIEIEIEIEPHKHCSWSLGRVNTIAHGTFILFIPSVYLKYLFT